jgi:protein AATF/BFR2
MYKQSVLSQIRMAMNDTEKLVKRSQLKRSEYNIIGESSAPENVENEEYRDAHLSQYFEGLYDDDDFYQDLLKELIESRIADTGIFSILIAEKLIANLFFKKKWE